MSKQLVLALAAGTTAFAAVVGSAATIGGISSDDLGADTSVVASCDTDGITVEYDTSYVASTGVYEVSSITLGGIDVDCATQAVAVTLGGANGDPELGEATGTLPNATDLGTAGNEHVLTFGTTAAGPPAVTGVDAEDVQQIAVVISG
ncbi:hypothetical protein [Nocardioides sp. 503]|uniref:hypothetical protein n=1 Tax=Nocardioides sp. 503 TaxID=2508326 RepID=UPI00106F4B90|nr:hypothetical protein [Nocardioides sp. 503]